MAGLTREEVNEKIAELRIKCPFLSDANAEEIRYWSASDSHVVGTVIDPVGQYKCIPYAYTREDLHDDYPGCEIFDVGAKHVPLPHGSHDQRHGSHSKAYY